MSKTEELLVARAVVTSVMIRSLMATNRLPKMAKIEVEEVDNKLTFKIVSPVWLKGEKLKKFLVKKTEVLNRAIIRLAIWLAKAFYEIRHTKPTYRLDYHYNKIALVEDGLICKKILTLSIP